ncbi:MAG: hypothetical protein R3281_00645 [Balneolaceae bacterium]|nr:hypothetical protein [Balneolaceae bacterium]
MAIEMMYRIGIYDYSQYEDKWNDTEQECMEYLKETSIHSAPDNGMFDAVYPCGAMVNRLLGEALNPEDPGEGIIRFWKEMTVWRATARKTPSEKLFFRTLEKIGFSKEQLNCLYQLLTTSTDEPGELITHIRRKVRLQ